MDLAFEFSKADAAALRRGVDAWETPGFYGLLRHYKSEGYSPNSLAIAAGVLAEVRSPTDKSLGKSCRRGKVSEKRFRRVLASRDRDDLAHQLKTVVRLLGREANCDQIVRTIVFWGDTARRNLAQDYFGDDGEE